MASSRKAFTFSSIKLFSFVDRLAVVRIPVCSYNRIPGEDPGDIVAGHVQSCIIRYSTVRGNDIRATISEAMVSEVAVSEAAASEAAVSEAAASKDCGISRTISPEYRNFHSQTLGVGKCVHIFSSMFL